jgi:hypothetical protein
VCRRAGCRVCRGSYRAASFEWRQAALRSREHHELRGRSERRRERGAEHTERGQADAGQAEALECGVAEDEQRVGDDVDEVRDDRAREHGFGDAARLQHAAVGDETEERQGADGAPCDVVACGEARRRVDAERAEQLEREQRERGHWAASRAPRGGSLRGKAAVARAPSPAADGLRRERVHALDAAHGDDAHGEEERVADRAARELHRAEAPDHRRVRRGRASGCQRSR